MSRNQILLAKKLGLLFVIKIMLPIFSWWLFKTSPDVISCVTTSNNHIFNGRGIAIASSTNKLNPVVDVYRLIDMKLNQISKVSKSTSTKYKYVISCLSMYKTKISMKNRYKYVRPKYLQIYNTYR